MMDAVTDSQKLIEGFIREHVTGQGLDGRTEKAYRLDLEHFYTWAEQRRSDRQISEESPMLEAETGGGRWEDWMEAYLDYLYKERKLSFSTLYRKNRVFSYYLSDLVKQGILPGCRSLKPVREAGGPDGREEPSQTLLSRKEADAFFAAMNREYEGLDSEFRRRVCLRDMVMMELLFYHKIEIGELLHIKVSDYDRQKGSLTIRRKRGEVCSLNLFSQELQRKIGLWLEERTAFTRSGECGDWLFLSKLGRPLSMEMFIQIFDKYRRLAGIEKKLTPKDLKENGMKQYARELMMERCG